MVKEKNQELKKEMKDFLEARLEESSEIKIKKKGQNRDYFVITKLNSQQKESEIYILLHCDKHSGHLRDYNMLQDRNRLQGTYTCNVFLNTDYQFFNNLGKIAEFKQEGSLKKYSSEDLKKIAKVSGLVQLCLNQIEGGNLRFPGLLSFYEPAREKYPQEGIKGYSFEPVYLDYSHLTSEDRGYGFAHSGISKSLRLIRPMHRVYQDGLDFRVDNPQQKIATIIPPKRVE